jgi:cell division protein FtsB
VVSPQQPLPQLVASILSRRQLETQAEALPVQTAEEREMQDLKREIEALRRQVEEQLADREPSVQPRYAVAR